MMTPTVSEAERLELVHAGVCDGLIRARAALDQWSQNASERAAPEAAAEALRRIAVVLEMVRVPVLARFCAELAALVRETMARASADPNLAILVAQRASAAVASCLDAVTYGVPVAPLRLYRLLYGVATVCGAPSVSARVLFCPDASRESGDGATAERRLERERSGFGGCEHRTYQRGLLRWLQGDAGGLTSMRAALDAAAGAPSGAPTGCAWVAATLIECLLHQGLEVCPSIKRVCTRIERQMSAQTPASTDNASLLTADMLYFLAHSRPVTPRVREAQAWFELDRLCIRRATDGPTPPTHEPAYRQPRDSFQAVRRAWARFSVGEQEELAEFLERLEQARRDLALLGQGAVAELLPLIAQSARAADASEESHGAIAAALLVAEVACEGTLRAPPTDEDLGALVRQLLAPVGTGAVEGAATARAFWISNPTASAAREVVVRLKHAEQVLDEFFRDPQKRGELIGLNAPLAQCISVSEMLGLRRAAALATECRELIARMAIPDLVLTDEVMERVTEGIAGLGLYCAVLERGGTDADAILLPILGRLGLQDPVPARPEAASQGLKLATEPARTTEASDAEPYASDTQTDTELLAVFIEEAEEILRSVAEGLKACQADAADREALTQVRRCFHTLKGSSRMVGLKPLGEAAWIVEDPLNAWLDQRKPVTPALLELIDLAGHSFQAWVGQLLRDGAADVHSEALQACVIRVKSDGEEPLAEGGQVVTSEAATTDNPHSQECGAGPGKPVVIGDSTIPASLFQIFANEAAEHLETLTRELDALLAHPHQAIPREILRAAHTLAGISRTFRLQFIADLADAIEEWVQALMRAPRTLGGGVREPMQETLLLLRSMLDAVREQRMPEPRELERSARVIGRIRALHQGLTAASEGPGAAHDVEDLAAFEVTQPDPADAERTRPVASTACEISPKHVDPGLLSLFLEEAADLISAMGSALRAWQARDRHAAQELLRILHNFKGSAQTAGEVVLSEIAHQMEGQAEALAHGAETSGDGFDPLWAGLDRLGVAIEQYEPDPDNRSEETMDTPRVAPVPATAENARRAGDPSGAIPFLVPAAAAAATSASTGTCEPVMRVRAKTVERLVSRAAELSAVRAVIETEMDTLRRGLGDLSGTVARLSEQLRDLEIQTESQLESRLTRARSENEDFDPLELDRYTRVQELVRMLAEGVSDVGTLQQNLTRTATLAGHGLLAQRRLSREHHEDLMRVRTAPFRSVAERLHRVVRAAGRELEKKVELSIDGGHVEIDRSLLESITLPLDHLLRNAVVHGIEGGTERGLSGKPETGAIRVSVQQEATEVRVTVSDDGAGLDLARIRAKAQERGLVAPGEPLSDEQLAQLIFSHGFSTAEQVTELAGRGLGMDAVVSQITALGGRVEVASQPGQGTRFSLFLPVNLSIMQVVLVRSGQRAYGVPAVMVEQVLQGRDACLLVNGQRRPIEHLGKCYPVFLLSALLRESPRVREGEDPRRVLLLRSGNAHVAMLVEDVIGNREIVVKGVGRQVASVSGILGATVLGDGQGVLIINPVVLARRDEAPGAVPSGYDGAAEDAAHGPVVMVVDDSVTVRKVTGRLLAREGYRVVTARDGLDALERINDELPDLILLDIEMPRMDGFELTKRLKSEPRTAALPIIIITSRMAKKHHQHALSLGVAVYLGKPYAEHELLRHVAGLVQPRAA